MAESPETQLTKRMIKAIVARWPGTWATKIWQGSYSNTGIPDVLVCVQGRFVGMEVKRQRPGESAEHARARATPGQLAKIAAIRRAGGVGGVVLTVDEALDLVASAVPDGPANPVT